MQLLILLTQLSEGVIQIQEDKIRRHWTPVTLQLHPWGTDLTFLMSRHVRRLIHPCFFKTQGAHFVDLKASSVAIVLDNHHSQIYSAVLSLFGCMSGVRGTEYAAVLNLKFSICG